MPILETDELVDVDTAEIPEETADALPDWLQPSKHKFFRKDAAPKRRPGRRKNLKDPIADQITTLGAILAFVRPITGIAVTDQADDIAEALNDLAKSNDRLYAALEKLTGGGLTYVKLISALAPVVAAVFIETMPNSSGILRLQASMIIERGLSDAAVDRIVQIMDKNSEKLHSVG